MVSAFFSLGDDSSKLPFILKLEDAQLIQHARDILSGKETRSVHVSGTISATQTSYNLHWSFHLEPSSIRFFEMAIEVCDASVAYVSENIGDVGGSFLPNNFWCPWSSKLICEVHPPGA